MAAWEDLDVVCFDAAVEFFAAFTEDEGVDKWVKGHIRPTERFSEWEEEAGEYDFDTAYSFYKAFFAEEPPFGETELKSFLAHFSVETDEESGWEALAELVENRLGWSVYELLPGEAEQYQSEPEESDEAFEAWYDALCARSEEEDN